MFLEDFLKQNGYHGVTDAITDAALAMPEVHENAAEVREFPVAQGTGKPRQLTDVLALRRLEYSACTASRQADETISPLCEPLALTVCREWRWDWVLSPRRRPGDGRSGACGRGRRRGGGGWAASLLVVVPLS